MIKKFKRRWVYVRLKNNIRTVDLAEMRSFSSKNWGVKYLLRIMDVFTTYAWAKSLLGLKDQKWSGKTYWVATTGSGYEGAL